MLLTILNEIHRKLAKLLSRAKIGRLKINLCIKTGFQPPQSRDIATFVTLETSTQFCTYVHLVRQIVGILYQILSGSTGCAS